VHVGECHHCLDRVASLIEGVPIEIQETMIVPFVYLWKTFPEGVLEKAPHNMSIREVMQKVLNDLSDF
jgi:hypothetical protein